MAVVHAVVQDAHDQDASVVGLEEDAVAATHSHVQTRAEVVTPARDGRTADETLEGVAQRVQVVRRLRLPPRAHRVPTNRVEIGSRDVCEVEALHSAANSASIWSSVSSCSTRPAAMSS